jgi:predicted RNA methylase
MAKKISDHILSILSKVTIDGDKIFLTCGQLDRKDYVAVNEVLENMGGKWNKKLKAHVFESDPTDKLEDVLLVGEIVDRKKELNFFPTPFSLAKHIVEDLADINIGQHCLEPSAGMGNIADVMRDYVEQKNIMCVEIDPEHCKLLKEKGYYVLERDFLEFQFGHKYDRIVMNPPFSKQQDIKHVMKAWDFLAEDGILVSIMSPGFTFRENKLSVEFRKLVDEYGWYEKNPEKSFSSQGTNINTVTVVLKK